ncbi:MAG: glycosyltransferase family 2 protein [Candidatus Marinimicrobia bacterium]|nr:glycosyltransferase family 2 protein [Candidatus Neomarinimicrobiota bacterium]
MAKSVNIFVLNWNGRDLTLDCLASLEKVTYSNANVIVIDNGSTDDSVVSIKDKYPETDIIEFSTNLGFAGGNNAGFQSTANKADYTIFLNNDTIVDPYFVEPLINELEIKSNTKQTAPKIYYADKPETIWFAGGKVNLWTGFIRHIGIRKKDSHDYSKKREIDYATGCCICMRTQDFESIGLFDQTFPMYAEDVDLSIRLKQKGGSIVFIPKSKVWHKVSASLGGEFSIVKWKRKLIGKIKLVAKHCKLYQIPFSVLLVLFMSIFELTISLFFIIVKKD